MEIPVQPLHSIHICNAAQVFESSQFNLNMIDKRVMFVLNGL